MGALKLCVYFSIQSNFLLALRSYDGFPITNYRYSLLKDLKRNKGNSEKETKTLLSALWGRKGN